MQTKSLYSETFDASLRLRVTTHVGYYVHALVVWLFTGFLWQVLRTIDKLGGLDNYLLNTSDSKLDSELGSRLKAQLAEHKRRVLAGEPLLPLPKEALVVRKP